MHKMEAIIEGLSGKDSDRQAFKCHQGRRYKDDRMREVVSP
jgi:hypothetical protein